MLKRVVTSVLFAVLVVGVAGTRAADATEAHSMSHHLLTTDALAVSAQDSVPPSAPTELTAESLGGGGIFWLQWRGSVDNVGGSGIAGYQIYAGSTLVYTTGGETSMVICLDPGTYTFSVRAIDRSGNVSAPSNAVEVSG
jgi:hypothetical protein